jgi:hypothetical protein
MIEPKEISSSSCSTYVPSPKIWTSNLGLLQPIYTRRGGTNACVACDLDFDSCSERRGEEALCRRPLHQQLPWWTDARSGHGGRAAASIVSIGGGAVVKMAASPSRNWESFVVFLCL